MPLRGVFALLDPISLTCAVGPYNEVCIEDVIRVRVTIHFYMKIKLSLYFPFYTTYTLIVPTLPSFLALLNKPK